MNTPINPTRSASPALVAVLAAAFAGLGASPLSAANIVRNGNATTLIDPAAWTGAAVPGTSDIALWNSSSTSFAGENIGGNLSLSGINIGGGTPGSVALSSSPASSLTLGADGININSGGATNRGISIANSVGIILGANQTWDLGIGQSAANITANGTISGPGSLTVTRASTGNNTLSLFGNNTFTGGFTLSANTTVIATGGNAVIAVGGDTTSSAFGAYSGSTALTINGGRINLPNTSGYNFHAKNVNINGDFTLQTTTRTEVGGNFTLGNATRTVTLTRSANATNTIILGGNIALRFSGNANGPATIGNGSLRIVADSTVPATNFVPVMAAAGTVYTANAGLVLGDRVFFAAGTTLLTGATTIPSLTLESGSWWSLNEGGAIRNPQVNSLAGAGTVANLYNGNVTNTLATLTIRGNSGSTPTDFSGRIIDRDTTVFPAALNGITAVVKSGNTTQIFSGPNTYSAGTTIQAGTLKITGNGTLGTGSISLGNATTASTLDFTGLSLANTSLSVVNGTVTGGNLTLSGATTLSKGYVSANLLGATSVTKSTTDTVTLTGNHSYSGTTTVSAGRLDLVGSLASDITVSPGAALGGEPANSGNLTFSAGASTLYFDPTTPGSITAASVNASGATVTVSPVANTTGSGIVVLSTSSGITGGLSAFQLATRGSLSLSGDSKQLLAAIPAPGDITLTWTGSSGTNPTFWDSNTTLNFANGSTGSVFYSGDNALFDDTATGFAVAIQGTGVSPTLTTFNNSANAYTVTGAGIIGSGSLVKNGTNTLVLANANTFTGGVTINAGTLQLGNGSTTGSLAGSGAVVNNGVFRINRSNAVAQGTDFGLISGSGSLVKDATNTVTLSLANTFSGNVTVNAGTLQLGNASALGTTAGSTTVVSGASLVLNDGITVTGESVTIGGTGNGVRGVIRVNSGNATWAGPVIINSVSPSTGLNQETRLGGSVTAGGTLTFAGVISGGDGTGMSPGPLGYAATVAIRSNSNTDTVVLSAANTFNGDLGLFYGNLRLSDGDNRIPVTARLLCASFSGGPNKLDLNGTNQQLAGLTNYDTTGNLVTITNESLTASTLTINTSDSGLIFSGPVAGNLAFVKSGSGDLTLNGANSYTGDTSVTAGILALGQATLADSSTVRLTAGKLNLAHGAADTVQALYLNGTQVAAGTYGATGSGAANIDDAHFSGSGTLNVTTGPAIDPLVSWASGFGLTGPDAAPGFDYDNDGLANLLEWVLGGNPTVSDSATNGVDLVKDATYLNLVFDRADATESTVTLTARWGTNLSTWNDVPVGATSSGPDANGVIVNVVENGSSPDTVTVSIPLTNAVGGRLFGALRATK